MKNILKKFMIGALLCCSTIAFADSKIWDGSADISWYNSFADTFTITTAEQLAGLAKLVNEGRDRFDGKTIALGSDILLNDTTGLTTEAWLDKSHREWIPIGDGTSFEGTFDGFDGKNNYKIYGLYIKNENKDNVGLFGRMNHAKISNLDILGGRVLAQNDVGALAGSANDCSITNVHIKTDVLGIDHVGGLAGILKGHVVSSSVNADVVGRNYVGGIAGSASVAIGKSDGTIMFDSRFLGNVSGSGDYIGGLIGSSGQNYYFNGVTDWSTVIIVKNSYSTGTVKGKNYVGGAIGSDESYIEYVRMSFKRKLIGVNVQGSVEGQSYVGGLIGHIGYGFRDSSSSSLLDFSISDCGLTKGNVTGVDYIGGLVGNNTYSSISNSYSEGSITGTSDYVGGLVGYTTSSISDSHFKGDVTSVGNYVGGLVGAFHSEAFSATYQPRNVVRNSYVRGSVKGSNYVGGAIGMDSVYRDSSYSLSWTREITRVDVQGTIDGQSYVGGIVGKLSYFNQNANTSYRITTMIDSCSHTKGNVNGTSFVGGLIGYNTHGSVKNSHSEGDVVGIGDHVGGLIGFSYYFWEEGLEVQRNVAYNSYSVGNVKGNNYIGGAIGLDSIRWKRYSNRVFLTNRIAKINAQGSIAGNTYVGGVAGGIKSNSPLVSIVSIMDSIYHIGGTVNGVNFVGGVIGYIDGSISSSYSMGDVIGAGDFVGGVVGLAVRSLREGTIFKDDTTYIKYSYSVGNVKGRRYVGGVVGADSIYRKNDEYNEKKRIVKKNLENSSKGRVEGISYVGGLIGKQESGGNVTDVAFYVNSCSHSDGDVIADSNYVGGLVGFSKGVLDSSSHIDGNVVGNEYVGGLTGYTTYTIMHSYSRGNVVGTNSYVGGVLGYGVDVRRSYAEGNVSSGSNYVGGLVGFSKGIIDSSYHIGESVTGYSYVGGLVGKGESISRSMALGNVSGKSYLGGLVGMSNGNIVKSYANGNVVGDNYIGGLIGYAKGALKESYVSGNIEGGEGDSVYVGCVIGYVNGSLTVSDSYYDSTKCSLDVNDDVHVTSVAGTFGKNTTEMQTQSTFENWNFKNYWLIKNDVYPYSMLFTNTLALATIETENLEGFVYDGKDKKPRVLTLSIFGEVLTENEDYTVTYENNRNAGTAIMTICGINSYISCKKIPFKIEPAAIELVISPIENTIYTGVAATPKIVVYDSNKMFTGGWCLLEEGCDHLGMLPDSTYMVDYKDNINAGIATVLVTMKGNYRGSDSTTFVIEKVKPVITQKPRASDVVVGEKLISSNLSDGSASVDGSFVWKYPEIKPSFENEGYAVEFIPVDMLNYEKVEIEVPIKVLDTASVEVCIGEFVLDNAVVVKGRDYVLPVVPDSVGFDFEGFYKNNVLVGTVGDKITIYENTEIYAVYKKQTFVVTFVKNNNILSSNEVEYGLLPTAPLITSPESTAQYTYSFIGWDNEIVAVTGPVTYTAIFDSVVNMYEILFVNYDGEELKRDSYLYGTAPASIVKPSDPTKFSTEKYTYTFKGWNPTITTVTGSATYKAVFDSSVQKYTVVFKNGNDTLQTISVAYGETPKYTGKTPTKKSTNDYSYEFVGWSPKLGPVAKETEFYAIFDSTKVTGIMAGDFANLGMSVNVVSRNIQISAAPVGKAYALFDMQGRVLQKGRIEFANYNIVAPRAGSYFIRIGNQTRKIEVK